MKEIISVDLRINYIVASATDFHFYFLPKSYT